MTTEPENLVDAGKKTNRSSALSPEQMAEVTAQSNAAVQEAVQASVKAVFESLGPLFEKMALTPEKIQALKAPYIDPQKEGRERREAQMGREQVEEQRKQEAWRKEHCQHKDKNGNDSICVIHNHPDHQVRGVCVQCNDLIHPREWRVESPDPETGRLRKGPVDFKAHPEAERTDTVTGKTREYYQGAYLVPAHKDYSRVLQIESHNG